MSISAAACHYLRALSVAGVPSNPTLVSFFAWTKFAPSSAVTYRSLITLDSADSAAPDSGVRFHIGGSCEIRTKAASGGTTQDITGDAGKYAYQGGEQNAWRGMAGWMDTTQSTADLQAYWHGTASTAGGDVGNIGTADDFYVLRRSTIGTGWGGGTDATEADVKLAHLAVWFGYKLTGTDITNLLAGTNPQDIGAGAIKRFYWPLATESGDGLVDDINGITLSAQGGSAVATWHDADNPTVSAPTGGGGGSKLPFKLQLLGA